jgi:hypothetical protein
MRVIWGADALTQIVSALNVEVGSFLSIVRNG